MTREELQRKRVQFANELKVYRVPMGSYAGGVFEDVCRALEEAWATLAAWESNGLTEEMLRDHEGYLTINRGIVLVSEGYLAELQAERDAAIGQRDMALKERDDAIKERGFLSSQNSELIEDIAALTLERDDAIKDGLVQSVRIDELEGERDALNRQLASPKEPLDLCGLCGQPNADKIP